MNSSQRELRVLFVSHDSDMYGAQQCLANFLMNVDRHVISPYVVCPYKGPLVEILERHDIPVFVRSLQHWVTSGKQINANYMTRLSGFLRGLRHRVWAIAHLIESHNIDVVYTNTCTCIEGALAAKITKRPHVWHLHEIVRSNRELRALLPQWALNLIIPLLSTRVLVNSRFVADAYRTPPAATKTYLVYNGINLSQFQRARPVDNPIFDQLHLSPKTKMVAIIGALHPRKGITTFIDAAAIVKANIDNVIFLVIGSGSSEFTNRLQNHVAEKALTGCVHFLGWRNDINEILAVADLLVVAAEQEPFGLTIVEAMASGMPVVATRSGGPEEIVLDGKTGLLVSPAKPQELAEGIIKVLQDGVLAKAFGSAGRERARLFDLEHFVSHIQQHIAAAAGVPDKSQGVEYSA